MAKYKEYGYDLQDGVDIILEGTIEIKKSAFWCCEHLTEVCIPKGCEVDKDAFEDCPNVQIIRN